MGDRFHQFTSRIQVKEFIDYKTLLIWSIIIFNVYLSLSLTLCLSPSLCLSLTMSPSPSLPLSFSLCLSLPHSLALLLSLALSLSLCLSLSRSLYFSRSVSLILSLKFAYRMFTTSLKITYNILSECHVGACLKNET